MKLFSKYLPVRGSAYFKISQKNVDEISESDVFLQKELLPQKTQRWSSVTVLLLLALSVTLSGIIGFQAGKASTTIPKTFQEAQFMDPSQGGKIAYPMIYNRTFTLPPSDESDAAWAAMFPEGLGFVQHKEISPNLSGIAVFHELHCVNMLRIGYYAALDGTIADMQDIHDHNKRPDPHHLRHCFDYLRQSLICAADTNLEPVDFELGGVTGWSFQRTCKNFEGVKTWAEKWRSWNLPERKSESVA